MIISARKLSSTACWICLSVIATPAASALARTLSPTAFAGAGPHWPSSAAVSSSVGAGGQSARAQLGPSALRCTSVAASSRPRKKAAQLESTLAGSRA